MQKERNIIIKVIDNKKININRLAKFFADKYNEKIVKEKS